MKFISQIVIALSFVVLAGRAGARNLDIEGFTYDPDSISQNEKLLRLFVKLISDMADHVNYLKNRIGKSPIGSAAEKNRTETRANAIEVEIANRLMSDDVNSRDSTNLTSKTIQNDKKEKNDEKKAEKSKIEPKLVDDSKKVNVTAKNENKMDSGSEKKLRESSDSSGSVIGEKSKEISGRGGATVKISQGQSVPTLNESSNSAEQKNTSNASSDKKSNDSKTIDNLRLPVLPDMVNGMRLPLMPDMLNGMRLPVFPDTINGLDIAKIPGFELVKKSLLDNIFPVHRSDFASVYQPEKNDNLPKETTNNRKSIPFVDLTGENTKLDVRRVMNNVFNALRPIPESRLSQ